MLISAIIVAVCNTTRTVITASEVELPLLVVARGVEYMSVCMKSKGLILRTCG